MLRVPHTQRDGSPCMAYCRAEAVSIPSPLLLSEALALAPFAMRLIMKPSGMRKGRIYAHHPQKVTWAD